MWDADKFHKKVEQEQVNKSVVETKTWDKCHKKAETQETIKKSMELDKKG